MKRTFAYGAATRQGRWPVQEDGFFVDPVHGFFVLADGFGGRGNGDLAAKLALGEARAAVAEPAPQWQRELLSNINKKLLSWNEKRAPAARGGCSLLLAGADREKRELTLTHCGSCAAFLLRGGSWIPLLTPQAAPRVSAGDPLAPDQALGLSADTQPESRSFPWEAGDILFLFSGGLPWDRPGFTSGLEEQLSLRISGGDLQSVAALAAQGGVGGGEGNWNQTALVLEAFL